MDCPKQAEKVCSKCGVWHPISEFSADSRRRDGLRSHCKPCVSSYAAHWHANNRERQNAKSKQWREANTEIARAYSSARKADNIERTRRWQAKNPLALTVNNMRRRARKLHATPGWDVELTDFVAREAADLAKRREASTGNPWHVDHMVPLQARNACGLHTWSNLQVIPAAMNAQKHNRMILTNPGEWVWHPANA